MTIRILAPLVLAMSLAACGGNPLNNVDDGTGGGDGDGGVLPGTLNPTSRTSIVRYEAQDDDGSGFATGITYDSASDTFTVDNLGFDGGNVYTRGTAVGSLGPFAVYEGPDSFPDSVTGVPISQFLHRAIYAVSPSGQTEFAIVRTGSYIPYGFGGFVYQRNGSVTLPTTGQASYSGDYAALRDFQNRTGIEFATGTMTMAIDFEDFDDGAAVQGYVYNRAIYDVDGNDITSDVLTALSDKAESPITELPTLTFTVGPGVMDVNGEIVGTLSSTYLNSGGAATTFESGNYYAIVSGDNAEEVVGVIVVEGADLRYDGVTVRETGGFILHRP